MFNKGVFNLNPGDALAGIHIFRENHLRSGLDRRRAEIRDHGVLPCLPGGLRRGADRASAERWQMRPQVFVLDRSSFSAPLSSWSLGATEMRLVYLEELRRARF